MVEIFHFPAMRAHSRYQWVTETRRTVAVFYRNVLSESAQPPLEILSVFTSFVLQKRGEKLKGWL